MQPTNTTERTLDMSEICSKIRFSCKTSSPWLTLNVRKKINYLTLSQYRRSFSAFQVIFLFLSDPLSLSPSVISSFPSHPVSAVFPRSAWSPSVFGLPIQCLFQESVFSHSLDLPISTQLFMNERSYEQPTYESCSYEQAYHI